MSQFRVQGMEQRYRVADNGHMEARLVKADKPGQHLWIMAGAWLVSDPQTLATGGRTALLDQENLVTLGGPICFKCEQAWSRKAAARPCTGDRTELQPWR